MKMHWQKLTVAEPKHEFGSGTLYRAKVPGGWLLTLFWQLGHPGGPAMAFYPDPNHEWDGSCPELTH